MNVGTLESIARFLANHTYTMPVVVRIGDQEYAATWAILPTTREMEDDSARLTIVALTTDAVPVRRSWK
jgi:hypothetical protein